MLTRLADDGIQKHLEVNLLLRLSLSITLLKLEYRRRERTLAPAVLLLIF